MSSAPAVLGAIFAFGALMSSSTPDGERVQQLVYDWLNRNYSEGPTWYATSATSLALEIRMISAFDDVEYNLANGGWAQFLWNCFDYYASLIRPTGYACSSGSTSLIASSSASLSSSRSDGGCFRRSASGTRP
jgi:hypothetical protein